KLSSFQAGSVTHINIDLYSQITGDINGDGEVNVSDVTALQQNPRQQHLLRRRVRHQRRRRNQRERRYRPD
ncbi:MAG: hypothetical protein PUJ20_01750, partial [Bacteroidales bacterium]|nr:hypothetical protein [Bacteroidales bacterium]MDY4235927.1 hypothetical protein [Sodaliphilus sp.]